uniref:Uncharacterized protein n=1 Tax=Anguilla anguilla TaxID=7936 RepID=A0A0E9XTF4_ANGAN
MSTFLAFLLMPLSRNTQQ